MSKGETIIVTRHSALFRYLLRNGLVPRHAKVLDHASEEIVRGKHVVGALPHRLSSLAKTYTEIPLSIPQHLRGKELTDEEFEKYAGQPIRYNIQRI